MNTVEDLKVIVKNQEKNINELKSNITKQENSINELKNTIKNQKKRIDELENKLKQFNNKASNCNFQKEKEIVKYQSYKIAFNDYLNKWDLTPDITSIKWFLSDKYRYFEYNDDFKQWADDFIAFCCYEYSNNDKIKKFCYRLHNSFMIDNSWIVDLEFYEFVEDYDMPIDLHSFKYFLVCKYRKLGNANDFLNWIEDFIRNSMIYYDDNEIKQFCGNFYNNCICGNVWAGYFIGICQNYDMEQYENAEVSQRNLLSNRCNNDYLNNYSEIQLEAIAHYYNFFDNGDMKKKVFERYYSNVF